MRLWTAADAEILPKTKPWALGVRFVVPTVRCGDVAGAHRSGIWHLKDALQPLDFGNGTFSVHPLQYVTHGRFGQMLPWITY